jgi:hypothetical protein
MRAAVLLVGNIRTWDQTRPSFEEFFGDVDYDVFISTYKLRYNYHPHNRSKLGYDHDEELTAERILELFSGMNVKSILIDENSTRYDVPENVSSQFHCHPSTFFQYLKLAQAAEMMRSFEAQSGIKYDVAVKTRGDLVYNKGSFRCPEGNEIIVDSGNLFPNDCLIISSGQNMSNVSSRIMDEFYNTRHFDSHLQPPHRLLYNSMMDCGLFINKEKMIDYVLRANDYKDYY